MSIVSLVNPVWVYDIIPLFMVLTYEIIFQGKSIFRFNGLITVQASHQTVAG